jgi:lycopene cyclase domain-containing protein
MNIEYLLFNCLIIAGPLIMSFEKQIRFIQYRYAFIPAILTALIPFIIWDALVTGSHWYFNEEYTLSLRLLDLPLGEWLFFITVPFACLFIWENIHHFLPKFAPRIISMKIPFVWIIFIALLPVGIVIFHQGYEYTGLVGIALSLVALLDIVLETYLLQRASTYLYIGIEICANMIFNGYLTSRPVVLYNPTMQLDIRIGTIPIEDFGYGAALILLVTIIFEYLRGRNS